MMNTDEMLEDLNNKFPRAKDLLRAWAPDYRHVCGKHEGKVLRAAYDSTMGAWTESTCPKPAHIAEYLPKAAAAPTGEFAESLEAKDKARGARAKELEQTARAELAEWWPMAESEGWAGYLTIHLARMAYEVARIEAAGHSIDRALTHINGREIRPGYPKRGLIAWADDCDAEIFRARLASQQRVNPACRRRYLALAPGKPTATGAVAQDAAKDAAAGEGIGGIVDRLRTIRETVNARIPPNEAA